MNTVEYVIGEIVGEPFQQYNHWFLKVKAYESYTGYYPIMNIMRPTKEELLKVKIGDVFYG